MTNKTRRDEVGIPINIKASWIGRFYQ